MKIIYWLAALFSSIGAINWGLVTFFNFDLVKYIDSLAGVAGLDKIIYGIVALAGVYTLVSLFIFKS